MVFWMIVTTKIFRLKKITNRYYYVQKNEDFEHNIYKWSCIIMFFLWVVFFYSLSSIIQDNQYFINIYLHKKIYVCRHKPSFSILSWHALKNKTLCQTMQIDYSNFLWSESKTHFLTTITSQIHITKWDHQLHQW